MENEQAPVAVPTQEAVPGAGAENEITREQEKAAILSRLTASVTESSPATNPSNTQIVTPAEEAGTHAAESLDENALDEKEIKNFRGRWDHLDDRERRVVKLATKRGLTLTEAYRAVYGETPFTATQAETVEHNPLSSDASEQAVHDDSATAETLQDQYNSEYHQQWNAMANDNSGIHVDAIQPGTELYDACVEEFEYLSQAGSPLVRDPKCVQKIASRMTKLMRLDATPSASKTTQPSAASHQVLPPQPPAPVAKRSARPVPAGGNPVEPPQQTVERRIASARSTSEMLSLMREFGTPFEAFLRR